MKKKSARGEAAAKVDSAVGADVGAEGVKKKRKRVKRKAGEGGL
jgi:hypothetical protein